mmetsp:Transcript_48985/g.140794  ORF Transcript_48985/g.140794 Transcript_48985/m.140794 type:complete len:222 (+) Transcript_48985:763-1428(+)
MIGICWRRRRAARRLVVPVGRVRVAGSASIRSAAAVVDHRRAVVCVACRLRVTSARAVQRTLGVGVLAIGRRAMPGTPRHCRVVNRWRIRAEVQAVIPAAAAWRLRRRRRLGESLRLVLLRLSGRRRPRGRHAGRRMDCLHEGRVAELLVAGPRQVLHEQLAARVGIVEAQVVQDVGPSRERQLPRPLAVVAHAHRARPLEQLLRRRAHRARLAEAHARWA